MPSPPAGTPWPWRLGLAAAVVTLTVIAYFGQSVLGPRGQAAIGIVTFLGVALTFSTDVRAINRRTFITGFLLQVSLALIILHVRPVRAAFEAAGDVAKQFLEFSSVGGKFVFGPLVNVPAIERGLNLPGNGVVFAFIVLPTVVFVSSFFSVLYYLGVLQ